MYLALYRKYRPEVFSDVVGQEHITTTLKREVKDARVANAYLFTGTRGTGKTTCARILAKAVNCLSPNGGDPCGECEMCRLMSRGEAVDIVEIDAASNRGVDNIRDIRDETAYTPAVARRKVYIIDEVHMLTSEAFNALLKTLEDTPEHVMFILATTEVSKVVPTVLSRCQRFDFRRIGVGDIVRRMGEIVQKESIEADEGGLRMIARLADGSMRDALSLLDRCAAAGGAITADSVAAAVGAASRDGLRQLAQAVAGSDVKSALTALDEMYEGGRSAALICSELTQVFRNLLVSKAVPDPAELLRDCDGDIDTLRETAGRMTVERLLYCVNTLQRTTDKLSRALDQRTELELCMLRLCDPRLSDDSDALAARIAELEAKLGSGGFVSGAIAADLLGEGKENNERRQSTISAIVSKVSGGAQASPVSGAEEPRRQTETRPEKFAGWPDVAKGTQSLLDKSYSSLLNVCSAYLINDELAVVSDNPIAVWRLSTTAARSAMERAAADVTAGKVTVKVMTAADFRLRYRGAGQAAPDSTRPSVDELVADGDGIVTEAEDK